VASEGPRYPAAAVNLSNAGSSENTDAWVSPTNVGADDGTTASITAASYDSPDISQILVCSNFGFTIPTGATIDGIVVEIDRNNAAGAASDNRVQLAKGTTFADLVGSNKADTATDWPAALASVSYGTGTTDLWGTTWTPAEINASSFAVFLSVQADAANTDIAVDYVRVTVHYTVTAPSDAFGAEAFGLSPTSGYQMGEASGSVIDYMGGSAGTASGTLTRDTTALCPSGDGSITFGGGNVQVPDQSKHDMAGLDFSFVFLFSRTGNFGAYNGLISWGGGAPNILFDPNNRLIMDDDGSVAVESTAQFSTADGAHVAVIVHDAGASPQNIIYIDGTAASTNLNNLTFGNNPTTALFLGDYYGGSFPFAGVLDEVWIYIGTALTSTDAADLATAAGLGGAPAVRPPILLYSARQAVHRASTY
jgi:hypothetical protein